MFTHHEQQEKKQELSTLEQPAPPRGVASFEQVIVTPDWFKKANAALEHYCEVCNHGFHNLGAAKVHRKFKHKKPGVENVDNSVDNPSYASSN